MSTTEARRHGEKLSQNRRAQRKRRPQRADVRRLRASAPFKKHQFHKTTPSENKELNCELPQSSSADGRRRLLGEVTFVVYHGGTETRRKAKVKTGEHRGNGGHRGRMSAASARSAPFKKYLFRRTTPSENKELNCELPERRRSGGYTSKRSTPRCIQIPLLR